MLFLLFVSPQSFLNSRSVISSRPSHIPGPPIFSDHLSHNCLPTSNHFLRPKIVFFQKNLVILIFPKVWLVSTRCSQAGDPPAPLRPPIIIICISTTLNSLTGQQHIHKPHIKHLQKIHTYTYTKHIHKHTM